MLSGAFKGRGSAKATQPDMVYARIGSPETREQSPIDEWRRGMAVQFDREISGGELIGYSGVGYTSQHDPDEPVPPFVHWETFSEEQLAFTRPTRENLEPRPAPSGKPPRADSYVTGVARQSVQALPGDRLVLEATLGKVDEPTAEEQAQVNWSVEVLGDGGNEVAQVARQGNPIALAIHSCSIARRSVACHNSMLTVA